MIVRLIRWSIGHRLQVILVAALLALLGAYAAWTTRIDAIPDLSDVQVTVRVSLPGQAPQIVEDQVTYPLSSALMAVPGAKTVRGFSTFGESYVYVIFEDGTDIYWARSRVLEYLNEAARQLPPEAVPTLGPAATSLGWVYEYALVDRSGRHDIAQLRSLQDWTLRYELKGLPGVAEVATVGGMVKQYQVEVDPDRLRGYSVPLHSIVDAIRDSSGERGGSVVESAEAEYMVRMPGYITNPSDLGLVSVPTDMGRTEGTSIPLADLSREIRVGPAARRSVADLDGLGEVVGGIVVMQSGANPREVVSAVKARLDTLRAQLPAGVEVVETYDRSGLIDRSVSTLHGRLLEEFLIVALVCGVFLNHRRSTLVVVLTLPVGILVAFAALRLSGIEANIMSLGGIALAVGTMVDAAVVMIENVHKHLERDDATGRVQAIERALCEIGPALFLSLCIITISFVPIFALQGQEGRLFHPLAFTKTASMAAAAVLSVTLLPALIVYLVKGNVAPESASPVTRWLIERYRPALARALADRKRVLLACGLVMLTALWPLLRLGHEFMPPMDEGDLLYMPSAPPGISVGKARELLRTVDRLIKTVPEVERVFGKVGPADSATDPAPMAMIESTIRLKPRSQWRWGMNLDRIRAELDARVRVPGLNNAWLMPIRARVDMQSTGINTPVGLKIAGEDPKVLDDIGQQAEAILRSLPDTQTAFADRTNGGRYIDVDVDRATASHYGLTVGAIQEAAATAIGGRDVAQTVEGRQRYTINVRYPQAYRDSVARLKALPLVASVDSDLQLGDVADVSVKDGPAMIRSENARINGWVFVTLRSGDVAGYVSKADRALRASLRLPPGYTYAWSGQYPMMQKARARLAFIAPLVLLALFALLLAALRNVMHALIVLATVPFSLVGALWLVYVLGYEGSVAVTVGMIALAGVAAEFGLVMMLYLEEARLRHAPSTLSGLLDATIEGAAQRVRPKAMTAAVVILGLLPIMLGRGAGSDVMRRIAAPMVGGMVSAPLVSMLLIPVLYTLYHGRRLALPAGAGARAPLPFLEPAAWLAAIRGLGPALRRALRAAQLRAAGTLAD